MSFQPSRNLGSFCSWALEELDNNLILWDFSVVLSEMQGRASLSKQQVYSLGMELCTSDTCWASILLIKHLALGLSWATTGLSSHIPKRKLGGPMGCLVASCTSQELCASVGPWRLVVGAGSLIPAAGRHCWSHTAGVKWKQNLDSEK